MRQISGVFKSLFWVLAFFFHSILIYGIFLALLSLFFSEEESLIKLTLKEFFYLLSISATILLFFNSNTYNTLKTKIALDLNIIEIFDFFKGLTLSAFIILLYALIAISFSKVNLVFNYDVKVLDIFIGTILLLFAAISEEFIFRFTLPLIILNFQKKKIIFIQFFVASIFTLVHITNPHINFMSLLNIFLGGITLSIMYLSTNNLSLPIGFHFGWNLTQSILFGINLGGLKLPELFHINGQFLNTFIGTNTQFEGSPLLTLILLLFTLSYTYIKKINF
jgi:membrane protease YdiL (CAAX protease family)